MTKSRLAELTKAAETYGQRSFDNYAQIRSIAETIRDGFCKWLDNKEQCVFLVPPQGEFSAQNYRSAAFSVSGKGFLPLEPIAFGLAVKISGDADFMRLILSGRKEGDRMYISYESSDTFALDLPAQDDQLAAFYETLFSHMLHRFSDRVEQYDNGNYGSTDIGFDIQRAIVKA